MEYPCKLDSPEILRVLFHPLRTTPLAPQMDYTDIDIELEDNVSLGCRFYIASHEAPVLFYFHGNGETVNDHNQIAEQYARQNINLFVFTYRGYGWSTGSPSATRLVKDALPCIDQAETYLHDHGFKGPRFVMGRSLGSVTALEVAVQRTALLSGMIVESGFADTLPLLETLGYSPSSDLTEQDGFRNCEKIEKIQLPTLILHGLEDQLIPIFQGERLQASSGARQKKFLVIPGADHNSMILFGGEHYFTTINEYIREITGEFSWRNRRKKFKGIV